MVAYHGVDHTQTYSQSVNLNRKGCFVLYDMVYYPGNKLHPTPVPGDQIDQAHYMKVLKKTGTNTAVVYVISQNSPAVILFRAPEGFDLDAYLADDLQSTVQSGSITYSKIPWDDWIVDGVEVCNMTEATKHKRLHTDVDAGYVGFSARRRDIPCTGSWMKRPRRLPASKGTWIPITRRTIFMSVRHNLLRD